MKTKPKLIRVLAPPVSLMMMQHQQQEHAAASDTFEKSTASTDTNEKLAATTSRDALYESLVHSRPLATFAFETKTSPIGIGSNYNSNNAGYNIQHTALHPCKSWATYYFYFAGDDGGGEFSGNSNNSDNNNSERNSWVIVQDTKTRRIIFSMSLAELSAEALAFHTNKANSNNNNNNKGKNPENNLARSLPQHLGAVTHLTFLDQSTLYWNGFAGNDDDDDDDEKERDNNIKAKSSCWSYLMVHCPNRVLIVDLQTRGAGFYNASSETNTNAAAVIADMIPNSFSTAANIFGRSFSSNTVVPVSRNRFLVALVDGSLRIYDWNLQIVVQFVKWSTTTSKGKSPHIVPVKGFTDNPKTSDAIVRIIPVNPYSYDPKEAMNNNNSNNKNKKHPTKRQMVICLTKKEVAYLVDVSNIETRPPLACMEGGSVLSPANEGFLASTSASMEHLNFRYDAFRDLFFWVNPSKNNKSKLFVWNLSIIVSDAKLKQPMLQPDPVLVTQLSYEGVSHTVFPGWLHKSFPSDSVACLLVTKDGELQVSVAPLYNTNSSLKNPFLATVVWSVKLPRVMARDLRLEDRDAHTGEVESNTFGIGIASNASQHQPRFKVQSVACEAFQDPSTIFVGTTIGIQVIKLLDGLNGVASPGTRFVYFNANAGNMGKSVLSAQGGQISYSPLDPPPLLVDNVKREGDGSSTAGNLLEVDRVNPIGKMEYYIAGYSIGGSITTSANNIFSSLTGSIQHSTNSKQHNAAQKITSVVYESPTPLHLPLEVRSKRCVRNPPQFLASPSGRFVCCWWTDEMRYEILSVSILLETVKDQNRNRNNNGHTRNPLMAGGTGITSFAWVGDDDVFCLLYDPEQDEALKAGINLGAPEASKWGELTADKMIKNLGKIKTYKKGAKAVVDTAGKLKDIEGLGKKGLKGMSRLTGKVALGVAQGSATAVAAPLKGAGKIAVKGTRKGAKRVSKKMPFGWGKKKDKKGAQGSLASTDLESDDEDDDPTSPTAHIDIILEESDPEAEERAASEKLEKKKPWVELRMLVGSTSEGDETTGIGTVSSLGQLSLRTGNRNPPTILFGGPVLCVGSKFDESDEGISYFYTKKKGQEEESAVIYVSSGAAFPCPDIVAWDDDGKLCAIVIKGKVSVYLSDEPNFVLLGTVVVESSSSDNDCVISARFIHGALYCTTKTSIRCIFLGDLSGVGTCHTDSFTLASCNVPLLPAKSIVTDYESLTPPTIPMPLHHPEILGYQNGSLVLSTTTGIVAIPLGFPLLRIGSLISAGSEHLHKAEQWFDAVPNCDHEALATFLERRGVPILALNLYGISLETTIDICMRYGFVDRLEEVVEMYGLNGIRAIDQSRGLSSNIFGPEEGGTSFLVCVGAYLLSYGRIELVRRIATECLASGKEGKKDAFLLAGLLLSINESDSKRVIHRSVENIEDDSDWVVGPFVRKHVL